MRPLSGVGAPCARLRAWRRLCETASVARRDDSGTSANSDLTTTLASGKQAQFRRTEERWQLVVDGTPQSEVNLLDPTDLAFGYIRHMGHVLDLAFPERKAITALHLGGGALTLPRYIDATRPLSRQQVIELERDLMEFVRVVAPLPRHASIRLRYGDAREQLDRLPPGLHGNVDAVIVDVFAGSQTPAHVTSVEFFESVQRFVAPGGVVLVNVADGGDLTFARSEVATLREVFGAVTLVADPGMLKGRRFGNLVVAASSEPLELPGLARMVAAGFPPASVMNDEQVPAWLRGASPVRDADAVPSPLPKASLFT